MKSTYTITDEEKELEDISIENMPDNIFLIMGDLRMEDRKLDFEILSGDDICWSTTEEGKTDVEYIRKDIMEKMMVNRPNPNSIIIDEQIIQNTINSRSCSNCNHFGEYSLHICDGGMTGCKLLKIENSDRTLGGCHKWEKKL